jgi:hypothetical protein
LLLVLLALGVISANMGGKLFVALQLEVVHHFIERHAGWPAGGFEPPATFGTTQNPENAVVQPTPVSVSWLPSPLRRPHLTAWLAPTITIAA